MRRKSHQRSNLLGKHGSVVGEGWATIPPTITWVALSPRYFARLVDEIFHYANSIRNRLFTACAKLSSDSKVIDVLFGSSNRSN